MKELIGIMYKGAVLSTISLSACLSQCVSRIKLGIIPSAFQVSYKAHHMVGPLCVPTLVHSHSHNPITLPLQNKQDIVYTCRTILGLENVIIWFDN